MALLSQLINPIAPRAAAPQAPRVPALGDLIQGGPLPVSDPGIPNPRLDIPLEELFAPLAAALPSGDKGLFHARPLSGPKRELEGEASDILQRSFDERLLSALQGMDRHTLVNLGLQVFNTNPNVEFIGASLLEQLTDEQLRSRLYKNIVLTTREAGS